MNCNKLHLNYFKCKLFTPVILMEFKNSKNYVMLHIAFTYTVVELCTAPVQNGNSTSLESELITLL